MAIHEEIIIDVVDNGMAEATKQANALATATKKVSDTTKQMGSEMKGAGNSVLENGGAVGILDNLTGGYATTVKDAVEASILFTKSQRIASIQQAVYSTVVGASTGAMKMFRIALVSTGIGAIVVGIGLLIANFDKVKKAVLNLVPGLAVIGDLFSGLIQAVTDFIGVTSDASRALDKMVADSEASLKRNEHFLEANGDKFDEYTNRKIKANIDYNKKVKELAADEVLTDEEKLSRLKDFRDKADREILSADADRNAKLQKARDEDAKKREEEAKKIADERRKRLEEQKKLDEEQRARDKKIKEEANKLEFDSFQTELDSRIQNEIEKEKVLAALKEETEAQKLEAQREADLLVLEQANATQQEILNLNLSYDEKQQQLKDAQAEDDKNKAEEQKIRDKAVADNRIAIGVQTAQLIAKLAGEGSAIAKGVAVAQATIDTYKGAVSAYSAMSGIPIVGPVLGGIAAGVVVAAGIANVKKILATKPVEKNAPSGGASVGAAPTAPSFNLVQGTGANQIAGAIGSQTQPVQAFVVSSNVTNAQSLDRNIVQNSTL